MKFDFIVGNLPFLKGGNVKLLNKIIPYGDNIKIIIPVNGVIKNMNLNKQKEILQKIPKSITLLHNAFDIQINTKCCYVTIPGEPNQVSITKMKPSLFYSIRSKYEKFMQTNQSLNDIRKLNSKEYGYHISDAAAGWEDDFPAGKYYNFIHKTRTNNPNEAETNHPKLIIPREDFSKMTENLKHPLTRFGLVLEKISVRVSFSLKLSPVEVQTQQSLNLTDKEYDAIIDFFDDFAEQDWEESQS